MEALLLKQSIFKKDYQNRKCKEGCGQRLKAIIRDIWHSSSVKCPPIVNKQSRASRKIAN